MMAGRIQCAIIAGLLVAVVSFCSATVYQQCYPVNNLFHCYYYNDSTPALSWSAAKQFCQNIGYNLPVITDETTQTKFNNFLNDAGIGTSTSFWLGVHSQPVNRSVTWHWIDTPQQTADVLPTTDKSPDGSNWCSALNKPSGSLVIAEKLWYNFAQYICQYNNTTCSGGFIINSKCYKLFTTRVGWFTAINNCITEGGTLASFDDNNFLYNNNYNNLTSLITGLTWIGLIKSWWTWPDGVDVQYNKFYESTDSTPSQYYPPATTNTNQQCVVAGTGDKWIVKNCASDRVICQNISDFPVVTPSPTTSTTTTTLRHTTLSSMLPSSNQTTTTTTTTTTTSTLSPANNISSSDPTTNSKAVAIGVGVGVGVGGFIIIVVVVVVVVVVVRGKSKFNNGASVRKLTEYSTNTRFKSLFKSSSELTDDVKPAAVPPLNDVNTYDEVNKSAESSHYGTIMPAVHVTAPDSITSSQQSEHATIEYAQLEQFSTLPTS